MGLREESCTIVISKLEEPKAERRGRGEEKGSSTTRHVLGRSGSLGMGGYGSRVDENDVRDDGGFDDVSTSRKLCRFDREQLDSASVLCPLSKSSVWRDFSSTFRLELEGSQLSELYAGGGGYEGEEDEEDVRSSSMSFD
jgi:hypothetical protein